MTCSRAEALQCGATVLRAAGIEGAEREARRLLELALGADQRRLATSSDAPVVWADYALLLDRRAAHEPMAFIRGEREFWDFTFEVSRATLIPRPDSETLVHAALAACDDPDAPYRILDLGTGTGCLLLSVLGERRAAFGVGVDLAPEAAALAGRNARRLGLSDRAVFLCGDWAQALNDRFDLVLANPPYIARDEMVGLMPDVASWEPALALDGGADGLDAYRAIMPALPGLLRRGGAAVLEVGDRQAAAVMALGQAAGLAASIRTDLANVQRVVVLTR